MISSRNDPIHHPCCDIQPDQRKQDRHKRIITECLQELSVQDRITRPPCPASRAVQSRNLMEHTDQRNIPRSHKIQVQRPCAGQSRRTGRQAKPCLPALPYPVTQYPASFPPHDLIIIVVRAGIAHRRDHQESDISDKPCNNCHNDPDLCRFRCFLRLFHIP